MTLKRKMIAPSNAMFFISDRTLPEPPMPSVERIEILANSECILKPCQYEGDGDTELILGDYPEVPKGGPLMFDGVIQTPSGVLVCSDVACDELLSLATDDDAVRVRIWTDGTYFPARVVIGVGQ